MTADEQIRQLRVANQRLIELAKQPNPKRDFVRECNELLAAKDNWIRKLESDVEAITHIADNLAAIADHGDCYSCRTGGPCWYLLAMEKLAEIKGLADD